MSHFETILQSQYFSASANTSFPNANVSARDFRIISLQITASLGSDYFVRVKASNQVQLPGALIETPPDFTVAASPTNNWEYVELVDTRNGNFITGVTGFHVNADGTYILELNQNVWAWVAVEVFTYHSGHFVGQFTFKNNA